jgi:Collagen triple helix repeat (20 copies)
MTTPIQVRFFSQVGEPQSNKALGHSFSVVPDGGYGVGTDESPYARLFYHNKDGKPKLVRSTTIPWEVAVPGQVLTQGGRYLIPASSVPVEYRLPLMIDGDDLEMRPHFAAPGWEDTNASFIPSSGWLSESFPAFGVFSLTVISDVAALTYRLSIDSPDAAMIQVAVDIEKNRAMLAEAALASGGTGGGVGPQGAVGPTGPKGDQGNVGPKGDQGDPGSTGTAGIQGPKGDPGNTGATGTAGIQGPKGDPGNTGATGATGTNGAAGAQGPIGLTGVQGPAGGTNPFALTTDNMTLSVYGSYSVVPGHNLTIPAMAVGQWIDMEPDNGDWDATGAVLTLPAGYTFSPALSYLYGVANVIKLISDGVSKIKVRQ